VTPTRKCPKCATETDAPIGSLVCPVYHGHTGDGECPIGVDGWPSALWWSTWGRVLSNTPAYWQEKEAVARAARTRGATEHTKGFIRRAMLAAIILCSLGLIVVSPGPQWLQLCFAGAIVTLGVIMLVLRL